jgi:hypothetical protein
LHVLEMYVKDEPLMHAIRAMGIAWEDTWYFIGESSPFVLCPVIYCISRSYYRGHLNNQHPQQNQEINLFEILHVCFKERKLWHLILLCES